MVEVLKSSHPVANKEHRCQFCGGVIHKGEQYHRQSCAYDGRAYDFINHMECEKIADELDMFGRTWSDGIDGDEFTEYVWDAMHTLRPNDEEELDNMTTQEAIKWLLAQSEEDLKRCRKY